MARRGTYAIVRGVDLRVDPVPQTLPWCRPTTTGCYPHLCCIFLGESHCALFGCPANILRYLGI